jgi:hypothetical protein
MKSLYKYQREHYRKITVKRELYEHLKKLARERGKTIPDLIKDFIDTYIGGNIGTNTEKGRSIGTNIGGNIGANIGGNTTSEKPPATSKTKQEKSRGHVWCRKKSEIKNLEGYLNLVDRSYGLVDWWDEGDKYCFETIMPP